MHHIQKYILLTLIHTKYARFRDMRPPKVDSNAYSYHLKALVREGYIAKLDSGYTLSPAGLFYVDHISLQNLEPRKQPKIITITVLRDARGNILLYRKPRQPFIDCWMLPYGKTHLEDLELQSAAKRELAEKAGIEDIKLTHLGDSYIHVGNSGQIISSVLAHVFTGQISNSQCEGNDNTIWIDLNERNDLPMGPATQEVIDLVTGRDAFFFEAITVDWDA